MKKYKYTGIYSDHKKVLDKLSDAQAAEKDLEDFEPSRPPKGFVTRSKVDCPAAGRVSLLDGRHTCPFPTCGFPGPRHWTPTAL